MWFSKILHNYVRFDEIWWDLMRFSKILWNLVRFSEIHWDIVIYDETWWALVRLSDSEVWWNMVRFNDIWWELARFYVILGDISNLTLFVYKLHGHPRNPSQGWPWCFLYTKRVSFFKILHWIIWSFISINEFKTKTFQDWDTFYHMPWN